MLNRRIAVQDLHEEDLNGGDGIENRIMPSHTRIAASFGDSSTRKFFRPILLEVFDDIRDTTHRWRLLLLGIVGQQFLYGGDAPFFHATSATLAMLNS